MVVIDTTGADLESVYEHVAYEPNLIVISDFHLGNIAFPQGSRLADFLAFVAGQEASLCINGDGIDFLQPTMDIIASHMPDVVRNLLSLLDGSRRVYYVIGNHDLFLEHFLHSWGGLEIVPYLHVVSGDSRIHIEHGHVYDDLFVSNRALYVGMGRLGGKIASLWPGFLRVAFAIEDLLEWMTSLGNEHEDRHAVIADTLFERGFDVVIFGHTHVVAERRLEGKVHLNPGAWDDQIHYVYVEDGQATLKLWP